jgi:hypothetical protein
MARPLKLINWDIVEKKMEAGCTAKEIAASIPVEINTFYDRFKIEFGEGFADYADQFYEGGNANLKFTQYMKALSGNVPMLLLLGRERLGQGKEEIVKSPYEDVLSLNHIIMMLQAQLDSKVDIDANKPETE